METVEENVRIGPEPYVETPSVEEVRRAINRLKNGKAPGEDQLSPEPVSYTHLDVYKRQLNHHTPSSFDFIHILVTGTFLPLRRSIIQSFRSVAINLKLNAIAGDQTYCFSFARWLF